MMNSFDSMQQSKDLSLIFLLCFSSFLVAAVSVTVLLLYHLFIFCLDSDNLIEIQTSKHVLLNMPQLWLGETIADYFILIFTFCLVYNQ